MNTLMETMPDELPVTLTPDQLRSAVHSRSTAGAPIRLDGDAALRLILPVGRSGWAILAGYLGLLLLLIGVPLWAAWTAMLASAPPALPAPVLFTLVAGILPTVGAGLLGQRAIRRDATLHGLGRVGFAYVCAGLTAALMLAAIVRSLLH